MATSELKTGIDSWELTMAIDPVPASRPRVGKYGTYYTKTYARFIRAAEEELYPLSVGIVPSDETIFLSVVCVCRRPKAGTLPEPRGDVDNYAKAVMDAVTKAQIIWCDDKQVKFLGVSKRYAEGSETPHIAIRAGLTMGVLWLMEPHLPGEDIFDNFERVEFPDDDGEVQPGD